MKRLLSVLSLVAIINLFALGGVVVSAWRAGWLTRERVRRAMAVMRGEEDDSPALSEGVTAEPDVPTSAAERIQRNVATEERYRLELERREREIQDNWRLLEMQQIAFLRERETFEEVKKRFASEREVQAKKAGDSGLQKELEILSSIKSKAAKELLKQKDDADVVRVLMAMKLRQARKIVSACKTSEERLWIGRILGQLHERDAAQAEALGAGS